MSASVHPSFSQDLNHYYAFPAKKDLVVAVGGEFSAGLLLSAYEQGIFPWGRNTEGDVLWCAPDPRCVLYPDQLLVNATTKKVMKRKPYRIVLNDNFLSIIELCASYERKQQPPGSWIDFSFIAAYTQLHHLGFAHSVAVYEGNQLVGGLYGLMLGSVFFGESMISLRPNVSKLALIYLIDYLFNHHKILTLIDAQQASAHLLSWGATEISLSQFQAHLKLHAHRQSSPKLGSAVVLCS